MIKAVRNKCFLIAFVILAQLYLENCKLTFENGIKSDYQYYLKDHLQSSRVVFKNNGSGNAEVISQHQQYPFGLEMKGAFANNPNTKRLYNFKERVSDFDLGWADFGARYYLGMGDGVPRFLGVDPLSNLPSLVNWSSYHYAYNNPVRLIDIDGLAPGDPFNSIVEVAKDFSRIYGTQSIQENREFSARIYSYTDKNGDEKFTYNVPKRGGKASSSSKELKEEEGETVAEIHSHGAYDPNYESNKFSSADINYAESNETPEFITTPNGSLQKYDPRTDKKTNISFDSPSDPNDPRSQNNNFAFDKNRTKKNKRQQKKQNRKQRKELKRNYKRIIKDRNE